MMTPPIEQLISKLSQAIPPGGAEQKDQVKEQMKKVMTRWLEEMDFVTREEFEVQKAVLQKTRQQLDALTKRLDEHDSNHD